MTLTVLLMTWMEALRPILGTSPTPLTPVIISGLLTTIVSIAQGPDQQVPANPGHQRELKTQAGPN